MAKGRREIPPCCKSYGLPLYCVGWIPLDEITPSPSPADDAAPPTKDAATSIKDDDAVQEPSPASAADEIPTPPAGDQLMLVLGGGGGEGRSGVPNALVISHFDFPSCSLPDHPVHRLGTGSDLPYRMAVHPVGDGVLCSFENSPCRLFEWDLPDSRDANKLMLKLSDHTMPQLEDVGLQLTLAFDAEGLMLATGGEDGHLRVFKWPSMEVILDQADAHATVKDLDFSSDAKFLVSLGNSDPCRVWDLTSLTVVANLPRENGEIFGFCRFSQSTDNNQILYLTSMHGKVTSMHGDQGRIACWNSLSWKRIGTKRIVRDPISAFSVSTDGKFLVIGTIEGDIVVADSNMQVLKAVKKAHLGIVTAVVFSPDSRTEHVASYFICFIGRSGILEIEGNSVRMFTVLRKNFVKTAVVCSDGSISRTCARSIQEFRLHGSVSVVHVHIKVNLCE